MKKDDLKAVGLIVEYNPFHNGHKYHLEKSMEKSGADISIALMSSNFIQRGEPAFLDKWSRTEMALENGIDIVIELPVFYSNQSAEIFSDGAIKILDEMKVSNIVFGSEIGDIKKLEKIANLQVKNKSELDIIVKKAMDRGESYPNAMAKAVNDILKYKGIFTPNNILGIEYIKAILKYKSKIKPLTIKRKSASYHSQDIEREIASATAIRKSIISDEFQKIKKAVPEATYKILKRELLNDNFVFWKDFFEILKYKIISEFKNLKYIQDMEVGFENRMLEKVLESEDYNTFFEKIITKRYTRSRVQRILSHTLLNIDVEITEDAKQEKSPYIRLLGLNKNGMKYLRQIKNKDVNILTNVTGIHNKLSQRGVYMLKFEEKAYNIYNIKGKNRDRKIPIIKK
ncbi:MAG: nucleotidyltransferase [Fusobacteriota bacterium]